MNKNKQINTKYKIPIRGIPIPNTYTELRKIREY